MKRIKAAVFLTDLTRLLSKLKEFRFEVTLFQKVELQICRLFNSKSTNLVLETLKDQKVTSRPHQLLNLLIIVKSLVIIFQTLKNRYQSQNL